MSDVKKVSELDAVTTSASTDLMHLATDAGGGTFVSKKITVGNLKSDVLLLDQTTPQTVTGGVPDFSEGISCGGTESGMSTIAAGLTVNNAQTGDANGDFIAKTFSYNALVVDASADEILIGTQVVITSGVYLYFDSASGSSLTGSGSHIALNSRTINLEGYTHITNDTMGGNPSADFMDGINVASFSPSGSAGPFVKIFDGTQSLYVSGSGYVEAKLCGASAAAFADSASSATFCDGTYAGDFSDGTRTAVICDGTSAGYFSDSSRTAGICDGNYAGTFSDGTCTAFICAGTYAGYFSDGIRTAVICDGNSASAGNFSDGTNSANFGTGTYGVEATSVNAPAYYASGTPGITQQIIILDGDGVTTHTLDFTLGLLTAYTAV